MIIGHKGVVGALSSKLPPVSIITGPPSVGKRMIAAYAAIVNNIDRVDFTEVCKLTVQESARIVNFMALHPKGEMKFALIDLDNASKAASDDLLYLLEQPPEYARFSLISSQRLPRTLQTRGHKYSVGYLNQDELLTILLNKGIPEKEAYKFSKLGRVDLAMDAYSDIAARTTAINVLQAAESGDYILFSQAFKGVDDKAAITVMRILEESAAQNWKVFSPDYIGAFSNRKVALNVLGVWCNMSSARPTLAVRSALESFMKG